MTLDTDTSALSAAGAAAEEALALHRQALAVLEEGWQSETGSTATDLIRRQCAQAAGLVEALHGAAAELRGLQDTRGAVDALSSEDPDFEPMAARLDGRVAPRFETPTLAPAPPVTAPSSFPSWNPGAGSLPLTALPDIGGTLAGLVAQIADVLSTDIGNGEPAVQPAEDPLPPPGERATAAAPPAAESVSSERAASIPDRPVLDPPPQPPEAPPALSAPPESQPAQPETPTLPPRPAELLAAERPPEPQELQPEAQPETRTPCEIAADELPQVGE